MKLDDKQIQTIQDLSEFRSVIKTLKQSSWGAMFFGGWMVLGSIYGLQYTPLAFIDLIVGLVILGVGVNLRMKPSLKGLLRNGVFLLLLSFWNIGISIIDIRQFGIADMESQPLRWIVIGVIQFGIAIHNFRLYYKLSKKFPVPPTDGEIREINSLIRNISRSKNDGADNIVLLKAQAPVSGKINWKCMLLDNAALLVSEEAGFCCARKDQVAVITKKKILLKKAYKTTLLVGQSQLKGKMSEEHFNRFITWKEAIHTPQISHQQEGHPGSPEFNEAGPELIGTFPSTADQN